MSSWLAGEPALAATLRPAPPINRTPMAPLAWPLPTVFPLLGRPPAQPHGRPARWQRAGVVRRLALLGLVAAQTTVATWSLSVALPYHGARPLEFAILCVFVLLFSWVSAGFWTAVMGFVVLASGRDRFAMRAAAVRPIPDEARTAIVMPIANESVARVFAGLGATFRSLAATGALRRFDFFVLSDTSDPDLRVAEIAGWARARRDLGAAGRLFYRRRIHRLKRKSGNLADFCRRWGGNYRYMVVLDADSVMSGECLTTLVRLMEANPDTGIIQSVPRAAGRETLFARMQQFANCVYGPVFAAGLHFWELGESHYFGHNAIIRVAPFMRHCALGRLPGRGALAGEILSHDFVEAALMRRAGWAVWLAYDLPGSFEETPPSLAAELVRDRRWCRGNLINSRLLFAEGLHPAHRAVFLIGVMAYLSAPLWFLFLALTTALLAVHTLVPPTYFVRPQQLFPLWPEWNVAWAMALFGATATLLFLPKALAAALAVARGSRDLGGWTRVAAGVLVESVLSTLLAPIRMLFHTQFVVGATLRRMAGWRSPPREDAETSWVEAVRRHGGHSLLGVLWAAGVYWLDPALVWWLAPITGALALSIPVSVLTSRVALGVRARAAGLFLTPEEARPPDELRHVRDATRTAVPLPGFLDAVIDPALNALVRACGITRSTRNERGERALDRLVERARALGVSALQPAEKNLLLSDADALGRLHHVLAGAAERGVERAAGAPRVSSPL
jgi:membrane glycosyltransferase